MQPQEIAELSLTEKVNSNLSDQLNETLQERDLELACAEGVFEGVREFNQEIQTHVKKISKHVRSIQKMLESRVKS